MIQLHVRAPPGTRIEATEQIFQAVEDKIREVIPKHDLDLIVDNIGVPARSYNWAFADGTTIAVNDGVIMVALNDGHAPTQIMSANCARCCRRPSRKTCSISNPPTWRRRF